MCRPPESNDSYFEGRPVAWDPEAMKRTDGGGSADNRISRGLTPQYSVRARQERVANPRDTEPLCNRLRARAPRLYCHGVRRARCSSQSEIRPRPARDCIQRRKTSCPRPPTFVGMMSRHLGRNKYVGVNLGHDWGQVTNETRSPHDVSERTLEPEPQWCPLSTPSPSALASPQRRFRA